MKYEWEKKNKARINKAMHEASDMLPDGLIVLGIAIANEDTGEAALTRNKDHTFCGVEAADLWSDVAGDAGRFYAKAVKKIG